ncbi:hypothetical protein FXO38_12923 [Capsicum annuum]|nr:hypothetical protein FXO37_30627 [Capsicum annuum]KAF3658924.1 hypothetical protein FXO38_12923 [Capsicum annuum]
MQRALATHPPQCFSTPQFSPKHHYFHSLPRNKQYPLTLSTSFSLSRELLKVSDSNKQQPQDVNSEIGDDEDELLQEKDFAVDDGVDLGWLPAFPHVLTASMSNFLFGYHIGWLVVGIHRTGSGGADDDSGGGGGADDDDNSDGGG